MPGSEKLIYNLDFKNGPKEPKDAFIANVQNFIKTFEPQEQHRITIGHGVATGAEI